MDKALKERIVGAIVLVAVAVLLVPVFLDGTADESGAIQETILLPGQDGQSARQKTVVLDRDRETPIPQPREALVKETPAESTTAPTASEPSAAVPKVAESTETKAAAPKPAVETADNSSSTGMWAVQLGSFSSKENAERLAATLRKEGYAAFLSQLDSGGKSLHRVRVGPQKDRGSAEAVAAKLKTAGHKGQVVPHP